MVTRLDQLVGAVRGLGAVWATLVVSVLAIQVSTTESVLAQPAPEVPQRTFADSVEVRVINLEAVVVDRRGQRITGLGPSDFSLEVDGEPVPVQFFSEIADGFAAAPTVERTDAPESTLPEAAPGVAAPGERMATSYLVFIDSYFTKLAGRRNRILRQVEDSLGRLGPDDRMAIVAFDGRKLAVVSSWSQSREQLARALAEARDLPARGFIVGGLASEVDRSIASEEETARIIAEADADLGEGTNPTAAIRDDGLPTDICATIERLERRIRRAVTGVTAALRSFAQPPGRKVMMLLSGGWPQSAKDYLIGSNPFGAFECRKTGPEIYRPIYQTANLLGYTLYPVDVPPPDAGAVSAEAGGQQLFRDGGASSGAVGGDAQFTRTFEVHSTLFKLARETGGTAMIDGAAESAFDTLVDDTRTYYWLGFTPQWKGDDKSHDVKLKVLAPGLEVRTRSSYVDLSRETEISHVTESALLLGDLPGAQALGLELGAVARKGRGKLAVPIRLTIPMDAITMLAGKRGFVAELELRVAVVDDGGNRNEMPVIPVILEGAERPPPGAHAVYETSIMMRRRPHDVVVSLFDPLTETILAATGSIVPGSGDKRPE